jgi:hypothetical protein
MITTARYDAIENFCTAVPVSVTLVATASRSSWIAVGACMAVLCSRALSSFLREYVAVIIALTREVERSLSFAE